MLLVPLLVLGLMLPLLGPMPAKSGYWIVQKAVR
jgi:hypothetical protein